MNIKNHIKLVLAERYIIYRQRAKVIQAAKELVNGDGSRSESLRRQLFREVRKLEAMEGNDNG